MSKYLIFTCFLLLSYTVANSQGWLSLGAKVMYGLNGFYNNNILNDEQHSYNLHGAPSFGAVAGINIGSTGVVNLEGLLLNNRQELDFTENGDKSINAVEWNNVDLYLLYRFYTENGSHFELGPKMSFVRSVEQTLAEQPQEVNNFYADNYVSAVAGLGGFITGSEDFTLKIGFRLEYAVTDLVSDAGEAAGYPAFYQDYASYTQTHPFRAGVFLELNFSVGREGKYVCGRRKYIWQW